MNSLFVFFFLLLSSLKNLQINISKEKERESEREKVQIRVQNEGLKWSKRRICKWKLEHADSKKVSSMTRAEFTLKANI
jgi:hypothetical protein